MNSKITAWDDITIKTRRDWKSLRNTQYRDKDYDWYEYNYTWSDIPGRQRMKNLVSQLDKLGCYYKFTCRGIKWFGPKL